MNNAVTPEKPIVIADAPHVLKADMATLKAIQHRFDRDIYDIASGGLLSMRFDQLAEIISLGIGAKSPPIEAIEADIVRERGLDETKYLLMEWLVGAVSPEKEREKNVARLLEQIADLREATAAVPQAASRGKSTRSSA